MEESNDLWIGAPLVVHSRCQRKVFDISNEIAYNRKMIYATKDCNDAVCTWIHVSGKSQNGHYVAEQSKTIMPIVLDAFEEFVKAKNSSEKYPSIFIITPFRSVRAGLATYCRNHLRTALTNKGVVIDKIIINNWINTCIGTIHTFQGKEAPVVVLCLA